MTSITNVRTALIHSNHLSGEKVGDNADNLWFPIMNSCRNLFRLEDWYVKPGANPSDSQTNKNFTDRHPKVRTMLTKPIQIPSAHIKPSEESDRHQVGTWTL